MSETSESTDTSSVPDSDVTDAPQTGIADADEQVAEAPPADLACRIEAAILSTDRPLTSARLAEVVGGVPTKAIRAAIDSLNEVYEQTGRSFRIEQVADGWQILTLPEFADVLTSLNRQRAGHRLSPAAMETLAIIAYKQPILRAELEAIRGVACGEVLRSLMERRLIKIVGRAEELGRPMLYGTTRSFLEVFGLSALKDLPKVEELKMLRRPAEDPKPNADADGDAASETTGAEPTAQTEPEPAPDDGQEPPTNPPDETLDREPSPS